MRFLVLQKSEIGFPLKAIQYLYEKYDLKNLNIDAIATPQQALRALKEKRIDVLVIENYLIEYK